ncbi:hypothetical protein HRR79_009812 [Exophiala dermatitidis]|nr:hypothetical protein HRR79_009812 [Exophiala dermatitidis]
MYGHQNDFIAIHRKDRTGNAWFVSAKEESRAVTPSRYAIVARDEGEKEWVASSWGRPSAVTTYNSTAYCVAPCRAAIQFPGNGGSGIREGNLPGSPTPV